MEVLKARSSAVSLACYEFIEHREDVFGTLEQWFWLRIYVDHLSLWYKKKNAGNQGPTLTPIPKRE